MSSEEKEEKEIFEKVKIYINLEPLGLKFGYVFKKQDTFQSIINFVYNQVKKLGVKFELGRIIENKTGAILLTENIIGDFLQNNEEITVYSDDYGFTRTNFAGEDEHNSLKKVYYLKSVSDLYKSMNFLKKKRNEKLKQKNNNNLKKNEKKEEKEKKENKEKESEEDEKNEKEIELSEEKEEKTEKEENEEKVSSNKNKNDKKNIEKTDKKNKIEKKENKTEKKEKKIDEKEKDKEKSNKKNTEKKSSKKYLDDEDDDD
jgi:hypothetical protein